MQIKPIDETHTDETSRVLDAVFGIGYYNRESVQATLADGLCFGAFITGELAGVSLNYPHKHWPVDLIAKIDPIQLAAATGVSLEHMAYYKSVAVDPSRQGRGLAAKLAAAAFAGMRATGAKTAIAHGWLGSPQGRAERHLHSMGFKDVRRIDGFWADFLNCPTCGTGPCHCLALEMMRPL